MKEETFDVRYWTEDCGPDSFKIQTMKLPNNFEKSFIRDFHEPKKGCIAITIPSKDELNEWIEKQK